MPKTKRSFLQRLIGKEEEGNRGQNINFNTGANFDDDFRAANLNQQQNQGQLGSQGQGQGDFGPTDFAEPENEYEEQSAQPAISNQMGSQSINSEVRSEGEWSSDQEGQLTIDVYQTESDIVIKSTIAGVKPENLDVQINNDMVTIKGERTQEEEVKEDDYYYQECYWGAFSRSIILPVDIQANKAEATLKNGILTIRLPKASSAKARKIQVRGF